MLAISRIIHLEQLLTALIQKHTDSDPGWRT